MSWCAAAGGWVGGGGGRRWRGGGELRMHHFFWAPKGLPRRQTILYVRLGGFFGRAALPEAGATAVPK